MRETMAGEPEGSRAARRGLTHPESLEALPVQTAHRLGWGHAAGREGARVRAKGVEGCCSGRGIGYACGKLWWSRGGDGWGHGATGAASSQSAVRYLRVGHLPPREQVVLRRTLERRVHGLVRVGVRTGKVLRGTGAARSRRITKLLQSDRGIAGRASADRPRSPACRGATTSPRPLPRSASATA